MRNFFLHRRLQKFGVNVHTFWRRHKVQSTFFLDSHGRPFWCRRRHPGHQKLQKEIQKKRKIIIIHSRLPETTQRQARATHRPANTDENFARQICPSEIFAQSRARRRERERERGRVFAKEVNLDIGKKMSSRISR